MIMRHVYEAMANGVFVLLMMGGVGIWGCDTHSKIEASGTATVKHVVSIEFGVCDSIEDVAAKVECVKALLEILKSVAAEKAITPGS